jgi:hypothetical protein
MPDETTQQKLDAILGRALRDKAFRQKLIEDPAAAAEETSLSASELELVAGGLALGGGLRDPSQVMFCTEKTCNEKGGARVVMWTPVDDQPIFQTIIQRTPAAEAAQVNRPQA